MYAHITRIGRKLGVSGQAAAAIRGQALGLGHDLDDRTDLNAYYTAFHEQRDAFYQALFIARGLIKRTPT